MTCGPLPQLLLHLATRFGFLFSTCSFPPILFSKSYRQPPLSLLCSPTYLICVHLLPDMLCHKTVNYLICLLPFSLHYCTDSPLLRYYFHCLRCQYSISPFRLSALLSYASFAPHPGSRSFPRLFGWDFLPGCVTFGNCWSNSPPQPVTGRRREGARDTGWRNEGGKDQFEWMR